MIVTNWLTQSIIKKILVENDDNLRFDHPNYINTKLDISSDSAEVRSYQTLKFKQVSEYYSFCFCLKIALEKSQLSLSDSK